MTTLAQTRSAAPLRFTSAHQVAEHIRRMIFERQLEAGDRVPQDEIAAHLGVSRVPVREAVIALASEGWLAAEPHRGAFVIGLDENSTYDHFELIGMFYGFCARRAVERGSDEQIAQLAEVNKALQKTSDPDELWDCNNVFLRHLVLAAGSRRVVSMARVITGSIIPGNYFAEVPGSDRIHKRGMRAVMHAIAIRAGETAEREFAHLFHTEADHVVELLSARGFFSPAKDDK
ncbi:GntR family transcriptional regulator [Mycobacterium colombiense]|uniref:GntR family transcriptional regulator n=1 Tax=Mycobacterium colombiense TaxID=339268 RepID=UPI0022AB6ADE|nr:GntR family transcriptional regulator [Mycobacterium colombiense]